MDEQVFDLPIASRPGEPGVHVGSDGRLWFPVGLNVHAKSLATNAYFAQMQRRKEWDAEAKAGGRRKRGQIMTAICKCSYCEIKIGRGYHDTELYLYPTIKRDGLEWRTLCGSCATQVYQLPFAFCVIADRNWSEPYHDEITRKYQQGPKKLPGWYRIMILKQYGNRQITGLDEQVVTAWNKLEFKLRKAWKASGERKPFPRDRFFSEWLTKTKFQPATFTDLYEHTIPLERAA